MDAGRQSEVQNFDRRTPPTSGVMSSVSYSKSRTP